MSLASLRPNHPDDASQDDHGHDRDHLAFPSLPLAQLRPFPRGSALRSANCP